MAYSEYRRGEWSIPDEGQLYAKSKLCVVNGVVFHHSIELSNDRDQYHCSLLGYEIDIRQRGCYWVAFIGDYMISVQGSKDEIFDYLVEGNWEVPPEGAEKHQHVDEVEQIHTGYKGMDWYYNGEMKFKHFYGNSETEYYFGEVNSIEVKVHAHQGRGRYGNWVASVEGDLIPDCNFGIRTDIFKWLVEDWNGVE